MRLLKLITIMSIFSMALMGLNCKDSESPEGVIPDKFVGTWEARADLGGTSIIYTMVSNPEISLPVHLVGAKVTAVINKDGTYTSTFVAPGEEPEVDQGKVTIDEDLKIISMDSNDPEGETVIFAYEWEGDFMVLTTETEFDFTLEGNPEVPAIVTLTLKQTS